MMHPDFRLELIHERAHQLEQALGRSRVVARKARRRAAPDEAVALRLCSVHDDPALERLAQLGGRAVAEGRFVLAEGGRGGGGGGATGGGGAVGERISA